MASPGVKHEDLESDVREMKLKEEEEDVDMDTEMGADFVKPEAFARVSELRTGSSTPMGARKHNDSPAKKHNGSQSPAVKSDEEVVVGGDVTLKVEDGKPKLSRATSQKVEKRTPQLFFDHDDKTEEACSTFDKLTECTYANKHLGTTEHALECDCSEEWDSGTRSNQACGEDSDCINRATKMECVGDCSCGSGCQNRRFQHKQYADVTVIKTEKKGYGLRANVDLRPNDFIFEYIGEVIGENVFRRRMQQYDEEGIKHFYFMSLTKGEFVDATKRGNLGRFCNHSCNPNCYVDKWVVGDKLRMGVFAERKVLAGEELVFNYNVDRYGADPQPCYCGEPNCTGYIGGKTQTERGTKLSNAIIEALGIEDAEAWDTAVAKKPRKKKAGEDDEEYVNNVEPRGLDEDGVNKVMSSLMQCKEKWIAVKLLARIQRAEDDRVRNRVVRFHGYRILKTVLTTFMDDVNVCTQILDILEKMPRLTRNKIQDSNIEVTIKELIASATSEDVSVRASALIQAWSKLEVAYRIPRVKRDPNAVAPDRKSDRLDRRGEERRRSLSRSASPEPIKAPTGPRNTASTRPSTFYANPRPPRPRPVPTGPLPVGWFEAAAANGTKYYYDQKGNTTWQRPTMPASGPPPPPPKTISDQQVLNDLIKNIVKSKQESAKQLSATATPIETPIRERKEDKWKSYPEDKQKKLYESTIQPHIMHVVGKYKHKLAKDDLKRWAKEFAKQVVSSDFRKQRVEDVYKISDRKAKDLKKSAQVFFDKAVKKKELADSKKAEKKAKLDSSAPTTADASQAGTGENTADDVDEVLSDQEITIDDDDVEATPAESVTSPSSHKRRRGDEVLDAAELEQEMKKQRTQSAEPAPPPPPPPPPPAVDDQPDDFVDTPTGESGSPQAHVDGTQDAVTSALALRNTNSNQLKSVAFDLEPMQVATPPTTGSPERDDLTKTTRADATAGTGHQ